MVVVVQRFRSDAVHRFPDGRVRLDLPRKGRFVDMTPQQFLAKLAALVPPPHVDMIRYAGCFANRHRLGPLIVPEPDLTARSPTQLPLFDFAGKPVVLGPLVPTQPLVRDAPRMHHFMQPAVLRLFRLAPA